MCGTVSPLTGLVQSAKSVTLFHMTELVSNPNSVDDALPLGPQSLVWRYFGDNRMFLIGPRPAVLQNMLAELGQGVLDHSVFFADTAARVKRSLPPIFSTVYGCRRRQPRHPGPRFPHRHQGRRCPARTKQPLSRARSGNLLLGPRHVRRAGPLLRRHVRQATDRDEKEQIYLESKTWYRRYGVSDRPMPANYAEFERYWDRMIDEIVVAHPTAKYGVGYVTKGFPCPKGVPPVLWRVIAPIFNPVAAFLTTGGMPPRTRDLLGLPWSELRSGAISASPPSGGRGR